MKIAYLTDSSTMFKDLNEYLSKDNHFFIPLHIIIDKFDYLEGVDLDKDNVIKLMKADKLARTSQPSPAEIEDKIDEIIAAKYDVLVSCPIGSGFSGTQEAIYTNATQKGITVINLDSKGCGPLQYAAIKMFEESIAAGMTLSQAQEKVQHMLDVSDCYTIVDDLNHLKRGGRLSATSAAIGSFLKVKPILKCNKAAGGKLDVIMKVRTKTKAYDSLIELALNDLNIDEYKLSIAHFDALENAEMLKEMILKKYPKQDIEIIELSFVVGAHTGLGAVALFPVRYLN